MNSVITRLEIEEDIIQVKLMNVEKILYPVCPQDKHAEDNPDNLLPSSHQTAALCCTRSLWVC